MSGAVGGFVPFVYHLGEEEEAPREKGTGSAASGGSMEGPRGSAERPGGSMEGPGGARRGLGGAWRGLGGTERPGGSAEAGVAGTGGHPMLLLIWM